VWYRFVEPSETKSVSIPKLTHLEVPLSYLSKLLAAGVLRFTSFISASVSSASTLASIMASIAPVVASVVSLAAHVSVDRRTELVAM